MIKASNTEVVIRYNKLHAEPKQGKSLDIVLKKVKHKMVENMNSSTADALGLSRAILCNDSLIKKLDELQRTEDMYRGLVDHTRRVLMGYFDLVRVCKGESGIKDNLVKHFFKSLERNFAKLVCVSLKRQQMKPFVNLENIIGRWRSLGSQC